MLQRTEFERVSPQSAGIPAAAVEWLLDQLESGFTEPHGLIIMRHGKICAEGWWSPYGPGIRHGQQSHSKTYAATAVGIAYTEGLLDLNERIIDIFPEAAPENPSENLKKLTVHHVLCMGCGMDVMPAPTENWIRDFLATPVLHEPGTTYMYNSMGSTLLGAIVRRKTGLGLHEFLKPRLYDKIGILADNHKWMTMPDGMEIGGGGLFATTEDNLRLLKLYADGGVWNSERILLEDYVRRATSCQNASATEERNNPEAKDNFVGYGYQIWMCRPKGVYRADGAMGQFTVVVPDKDMILAITENASGTHWAQKTLDVFWEFLNKIPEETAGTSMRGEREAEQREEAAQKEDEAAAERLQKRLSRLALPAVPFAPRSPLSAALRGQSYRICSGYLSFENYFGEVFMGGAGRPAGIDRLSFDFYPDHCELMAEISGKEQHYRAALDGSRAWQLLGGGVVKEALMSGSWRSENSFVLKIRWIETCSEMEYRFDFAGERLAITSENTFMGMRREETAEAVRENA